MKTKVLLGMPLYDGTAEFWSVAAALANASQRNEVQTVPFAGSLLPLNCTALWSHALNLRNSDPAYFWFAMLHADIVPEHGWLDKLIAIAERRQQARQTVRDVA